MSKPGVDSTGLERVRARLGDAAVDPTIWPEILEQISNATGATGAALLQGDVRTPDIPRTAGLDAFFRSYFAEGWHMRDARAQRAVPRLLRGESVITDQDIVTPREMQRVGLYAESLLPHGLQWFAAVGFWSGEALWGLTIQRSPRDGPFGSHDKRLLARLAQPLTEIATLSKAFGRANLSGMTNALNLVGKPALALDRSGCVIEANAAAEQLFDAELRVVNRRLAVRDRAATAALAAFVDQLRATPDTGALPVASIVVRRSTGRPLVIRILPIAGAARGPFVGARVLLVLSDSRGQPTAPAEVLGQAFELAPSEARLAALIATGISLEEAAGRLGIARETARTQLKAVFAKTGTHRQGELVALLARL